MRRKSLETVSHNKCSAKDASACGSHGEIEAGGTRDYRPQDHILPFPFAYSIRIVNPTHANTEIHPMGLGGNLWNPFRSVSGINPMTIPGAVVRIPPSLFPLRRSAVHCVPAVCCRKTQHHAQGWRCNRSNTIWGPCRGFPLPFNSAAAALLQPRMGWK